MWIVLHVVMFAIHRHDLTAGFRTARSSLETVVNNERGERGECRRLLKWPTNHRPPAFFETRGGGLRSGGDPRDRHAEIVGTGPEGVMGRDCGIWRIVRLVRRAVLSSRS